MSIVVKEPVPEGTSLGHIVSFFNDQEQAVTPNTVTWKLTDDNGDVVNSRTAESETPATSVTIDLFGADWIMANSFDTKRYLLVEAPYDSVALGDDSPSSEEWVFTIRPLKGVPYSG